VWRIEKVLRRLTIPAVLVRMILEAEELKELEGKELVEEEDEVMA